MSLTLAERSAAYARALSQVHDIELSGAPEPQRLEQIQAVLQDIALRPGLFPPEAFPRAPGTAGGLFRLAQAPDGVGSLYVSLGYTGRGQYSPHTHAAWAVVVGISGGIEHNHIYERIDDGSVEGEGELRLVREIAVGPGDAVAIPTGGFHTIDVTSDEPVLHIHAYGRSVETPGHQLPVFETPESRTYTVRTTGGFRPPLAVVDAAEAEREVKLGRAVLVDAEGDIMAALFAAGLAKTAPVIVAGREEIAGPVASRLQADGHAVIFRLADTSVAQAA